MTLAPWVAAQVMARSHMLVTASLVQTARGTLASAFSGATSSESRGSPAPGIRAPRAPGGQLRDEGGHVAHAARAGGVLLLLALVHRGVHRRDLAQQLHGLQSGAGRPMQAVQR